MISHASSLRYNIKAILRHQVAPGLRQAWFLHPAFRATTITGLRTPTAQISRVRPASSGLGPPPSSPSYPAELTRIVRTCQSNPAHDVYNYPGCQAWAGLQVL